MARLRIVAAWAVVLVLLVPSIGSADPIFTFAVWLDGNTTAGGGGNGIPSSLTQAFGDGSVTLVTNAQLDDPKFLSGFDAVVISRFGTDPLGTPLSGASVKNIQDYVGSGAAQGGVAIFTNDVADSLCNPAVDPSCPIGGDPFDANLNRLFTNSAANVAATGHGYIGEENGAVMAMTSNTVMNFPAIGLLVGTASTPQFISHDPNVPFIYGVGPIGAGHPIDAGITFPFSTKETSLFLTFITNSNDGNIVDWYENAIPNLFHAPAIVANEAGIGGISPPPQVPAPPSLVFLGLGLTGLAAWKRGRHHRSRDN